MTALIATKKLQVDLNKTVEDIDNKLVSKYGYREVAISDAASISLSTPQCIADANKRDGWYYINSSGPTDALDITIYDSIDEKTIELREIDTCWVLMSLDNAISSQAPYFEITTSASVITYELDYTNTHLGKGERCLFYSQKFPLIGDQDARRIRMTNKTIVSGPAALDETVSTIKLISDSSALANEVECLVEKVGVESNKNSNISQNVARNITLKGAVSTPYTPSANSSVLWNAATPGVSGKSASHDTVLNPNITIIGNVDSACTITVENSVDDAIWYTGNNSYFVAGSSDFEISFVSATKYIRLNMDTAGVVITAISQSK